MVAGTGRDAGEIGIRASEEALLSSALEAVQELNERCLILMQQLALEQPVGTPQILVTLARQLRGLDPATISTIAGQPFLLVDFAFGRPKVLRELLVQGHTPLRFPHLGGTLPPADATSLARGVLTLAQSVCRHHPAHAGLLLGIDPSLHDLIAQLRHPDLERLAGDNPHQLRLRWETRPDVWQYLLSASVSSDPDTRHQFRMYGMQLIAGEMNQKIRGAL
jgi:hypothetical protein